MTTGLAPVRRAILSVSEKAGIVDFARALVDLGVEIVSTGGTARVLRDAGLDPTPVESLTHFPEMMDGRVKTLHPGVHGGILALRDNEDHARAMREHAIRTIDLVCVNLYPFEHTIARQDATRQDAIENIDIGGPAMIRAAAKNHAFVTVATDPTQYDGILTELRAHACATTHELRVRLAQAAFARTSAYDGAIARYLATPAAPNEAPDREPLPDVLEIRMQRLFTPRYGENPHQRAAVYVDQTFTGPSIATARQLHGKELSYNNLLDAAAALGLALDLAHADPDRISAVVVKHTNPCGAALGRGARAAIDGAIAGDPKAAYGGILALGGMLDADGAEILCRDGVFFEVVIASGIHPDGLDRLRARWKNLRVLDVGPIDRPATASVVLRSIPGAILAQDPDDARPEPDAWVLGAGPEPGPERRRAAVLAELICKHLSSNAIAIAGDDPGRPGVFRLFGAGAGQMDRVSSCEIAVKKAGALAAGAIAASDAFFPFPDGPGVLLDAGVTLLVHPGGAKRDQETFDLAASRGAGVLLTGRRHFRH